MDVFSLRYKDMWISRLLGCVGSGLMQCGYFRFLCLKGVRSLGVLCRGENVRIWQVDWPLRGARGTGFTKFSRGCSVLRPVDVQLRFTNFKLQSELVEDFGMFLDICACGKICCVCGHRISDFRFLQVYRYRVLDELRDYLSLFIIGWWVGLLLWQELLN